MALARCEFAEPVHEAVGVQLAGRDAQVAVQGAERACQQRAGIDCLYHGHASTDDLAVSGQGKWREIATRRDDHFGPVLDGSARAFFETGNDGTPEAGLVGLVGTQEDCPRSESPLR